MKQYELLHSLFVGIDVSMKENVVHAMPFSPEDHPGHAHLRFSAPNTPAGSVGIVEKVSDFLKFYPDVIQVVIALEATSVYSFHLATFLSVAHFNGHIPAIVYSVNPKEIHAYKKTFTDVGKDDYVDAMVIADYARSNKIRSRPWKGPELLGLRVLTRLRFRIAKLMGIVKNSTGNSIYLECSGLMTGENPFCNVWTTTCQELLMTFQGPDEILSLSDEELLNFITEKGHGRFSHPLDVVEKVKKAARNSYRLDKRVYEPLTSGLSVSFFIIHSLEAAIKKLDKSIETMAKSFSSDSYQILLSIDGVGPVIAGGLLAEIGDIKRFKTDDALAKYIGLTWRGKQSGQSESPVKHLSKAGDVYLRYYVLLATGQIINYSAKYREAYERIRSRKTLFPYRAALNLVARKIVRLIFTLLDKHQLYSDNKVMVTLE